MPYKPMPQFKSTPDRMFEMPQPGMGGLNLKDLEFEQDPNQSPYMKNVMYRNGAFAKRYGQEFLSYNGAAVDFGGEVFTTVYYAGKLFASVKYGTSSIGSRIYVYDNGTLTQIGNLGIIPNTKGQFMIFDQKLYYYNGDATQLPFYEIYEQTTSASTTWQIRPVEAYVPDVLINCEPDGTNMEQMEQFNLLSDEFAEVYNADGSNQYYLYDVDETVNWLSVAAGENFHVYVDDTEIARTTGYTYSESGGDHFITFVNAPAEGNLNVRITFPINQTALSGVKRQLFDCKFYAYYGGRADSRVFMAGNGLAKVFWSDVDDLSYFPENNWLILGNSEEDITGLGRQYNILVAFKPHETFSIYSYIQDTSNTIIEGEVGLESFKAQSVNNRIGCDCPYSIQVINNLLTWFSTDDGICTLVSTNIQDERNIRVISRNVDRQGNFGIKGILDYTEDPYTIRSADWDNKYFLVFPESGNAYVWDYEISPYHCTQNGETPPSKLAWFFFGNFHVNEFLKMDKDLLYSNTGTTSKNKMVKLNMGFNDFGEPIESFYMTPFVQFGAVESLKNVKNIYVQCRGETATKIDMWYYDEATLFGEGELEPETIEIGGRFWGHFAWSNFQWYIMGWANTFRRKCNLKKVQMAAFFFKNDELSRDMSITHIGLQYQIVRYIR